MKLIAFLLYEGNRKEPPKQAHKQKQKQKQKQNNNNKKNNSST